MMPPVLILAGGLGRRLRPVTMNKMPKPMVPVRSNGHAYPFLEYLLDGLREQGVRDIVFCVGHLAEHVSGYFGNGRRFGFNISYSNSGNALTGARVKQAMQYIDADEVLVHCGDVYYPLCLHEFWDNFQQNPLDMLQVSVKSVLDEYHAPNMVIDDNDRVVSWVGDGDRFNGNVTGDRVLETGVLALRRSVLDILPDSEQVSLTDDLYPGLIRQHTLGAFVCNETFYDIGTPDEFFRFCKFVRENDLHPFAGNGAAVNETV